MWKPIDRRILKEIPPMIPYTILQIINMLNRDKYWLFQVGFARIYPAIYKLQKQGYVNSMCCSQGRCYYWVTNKGIKSLS